jgi:hypothetical protein
MHRLCARPVSSAADFNQFLTKDANRRTRALGANSGARVPSLACNRVQTEKAQIFFLGAISIQPLPSYHAMHGLGDVGRLISHSLQILGTEQQMRAGHDVAGILHHVGQQLPQQRAVGGVDLSVARPNQECLAAYKGFVMELWWYVM